MTEKKNPWKKLSSEVVHKNPWFNVRQDKVTRPDGTIGEYNVVVTPPASFVVALDDDQSVYLIGQFRYPTGIYSIEVPGGGSQDRDPLEAAKIELQEETGLVADHWKELGVFYPFNGVSNEKNHAYLATGLRQTDKNDQKEEGIQEVIKIPFKDAFKMIKKGEITDGQSITAITMAALELGLLK